MKTRTLAAITVIIALLSASCHAADSTAFKLSEMVSKGDVKEQLDKSPEVKLYWGAQQAPAFTEVAKPDTYTRVSISLSPLGGSRRHCVDAFEKAMTSTIKEARSRGYDAVTGIQVASNRGKPSEDPENFVCSPGYKTTEITITSSFAMTEQAAKRMAEEEAAAMKLPSRAPAKGALFLPLEPMLVTDDVKTMLGNGLSAHVGLANTPLYSHRYGPEEYSERAEVTASGNEEACKQAVLKALKKMVADAKEKGYDSLIKIRSYYDEQYTPVPTDVECEIGRRGASVNLKASLANRK